MAAAPGVYAGLATSEYRDLMMMAGGESLNYLGTAGSMAVGGIAYKLGLTGACDAGAAQLRRVSGHGATGDGGLAGRRGGPGPGRRRKRDPLAGADKGDGGARDVVEAGALQDFRRRGGRFCTERGLWDGGPETPGRCRGRRRPYLGGDPGRGSEPEWRDCRADGTERPGAGAGDRRGAVAGGRCAVGRGLP